MITNIEINNFQSHKHSKLEFTPGVNIIIGTSDSGKSAIIRAIKWVVWNRPTGDSICSKWGGNTEVLLKLDGLEVMRRKAGSENLYYSRGVGYTAFGTDVPEEIRRDLNINEINLQQQLDRPFLLDSTPGEVASHFNRIAHLDQIDIGLKNVQKWLKEIEADISSKKSTNKELKEDVKRFENLDKFESEVEVLEDQEKRRSIMKSSLDELTLHISRMNKIEEDIEENQTLINLDKPVSAILLTIEKRNKTKDDKNDLIKLIQSIENTEKEQEKLQDIIQGEELINSIIKALSKKKEQENVLNNLKALINTINSNSNRLTNEEKELTQMEVEFEKVFPDICPLCGNKINKNHEHKK